MKIRRIAVVLLPFALLSGARAGSITSFDADWRFTQGDPEGAQQPQFDDSTWNTI